MKTFRLISFACSALLAFGSLARANLLVNPGFETGDFTGWQVAGVSEVLSHSPYAHSGTFGASLGEGTLTQAVTTTAGHVYDLSFYLKQIPEGDTQLLTLKWDNWDVPPGLDYGAVTLVDASGLASPASGWAKYDYKILALGNVGTLQFEFQTQAVTFPDNTAVDDFSLTDTGVIKALPILDGVKIGLPSPVLPNDTTYVLSSSITVASPVPEPSTYGMIGAAMLGGVVLLRRRAARADVGRAES
ncbi:MAG TPA: PEP-CTERM sorting domain-containing protein [Opitutaceae bacterium]